MELGGSIPHSQGLSNNPYPEPNQTLFLALIHNSLKSIQLLSSHPRLGLDKGLFHIGLPVKILKEVSHSLWTLHMIEELSVSDFSLVLLNKKIKSILSKGLWSLRTSSMDLVVWSLLKTRRWEDNIWMYLEGIFVNRRNRVYLTQIMDYWRKPVECDIEPTDQIKPRREY